MAVCAERTKVSMRIIQENGSEKEREHVQERSAYGVYVYYLQYA